MRSIFYQLRLNVYVASGVDKNIGNGVKVLFFGNEQFSLHISDLLFSEKPQIKKIGKECIWRINKRIDANDIDIDAMLISCDRFYRRFLHKDKLFVFPHMVDMVLDSSKGLKETEKSLSRSAKEDIRKVKKNQFSFEITSDIEKLNKFYYEMYLPTLNKIIGETEIFTPNFLFLKFLRESGHELMLITHEGRDVCGVFFQHHGNVLLLKYTGVFQGDIDLIKKGASSALYYFFIILAQDRKAKRIDFEGARPFFNDGLLQYKKKWGMKVEPYSLVPSVFGLKILNNSEPMKQFLIDNPFIGITEKNEMVGFVFIGEDEISDEKKELYEKRFNATGIHELRFIPV